MQEFERIEEELEYEREQMMFRQWRRNRAEDSGIRRYDSNEPSPRQGDRRFYPRYY
jgi:hypothetical protein